MDNRSVQADVSIATLIDLPEADKAARFDALQSKLVPLWQSIERMTQDEQTIVVVPSLSVTQDGAPAIDVAGIRGALPLPPLPAPAATRANDLRHLPGDPAEHRRLLPRSASRASSRRHARRRLHFVTPLDGSRQDAHREAPRAAPPARPHPEPDLRPRPRAPRVPERDGASSATWRSLSGSRCSRPIRSSSTSARRAAAESCSPPRASPIRSGTKDSARIGDAAPRDRRDAEGQAGDPRSARQAQRGRLGRGERGRRPREICRRPGTRPRAARSTRESAR